MGKEKKSMPLPYNHVIAIVTVLLWGSVPLGLTRFFPYLKKNKIKKWTDSIRSNIPNAKQSAVVDWVPLFDIKNSIFCLCSGEFVKVQSVICIKGFPGTAFICVLRVI